MYTLISMKTGKYIGSLFSDRHNDTFNTRFISEAYTWNSLESVTLEQRRHDNCLIHKVEFV